MDISKLKSILNSSKVSIVRISTILCFVFLIMHCYSGKAIQLDSEIKRPGSGKSSAIRIYEFGETKKSQSIILFSPVFWKDDFLWDDRDSLIPYLLYKNYKVYMISWEEPNLDTKTLYNTIQSVISTSSESKIYFGGISIGGQKLAKVLSEYPSKDFPKLEKVFFLGTGFDYDYPKSFLEHSQSIKKESLVPRLFLEEKFRSYATGNTTVDRVSPQVNSTFGNESKISFGFFWGKIDSVSPEESIYSYYNSKLKIKPNQVRDN
ncbi:MAG: hypothetical protein JJT78_07830 [Leptospira sp.]|nr:hypothetical protein [Leptospira sp.]